MRDLACDRIRDGIRRVGWSRMKALAALNTKAVHPKADAQSMSRTDALWLRMEMSLPRTGRDHIQSETSFPTDNENIDALLVFCQFVLCSFSHTLQGFFTCVYY